MIAFEPPAPVAVPPSDPEIRQRLRLQSIGWALDCRHQRRAAELALGVWKLRCVRAVVASFTACWPSTCNGWTLMTGICRQGLVGAVCGLRSLGMPLPLDNWQVDGLASLTTGATSGLAAVDR